MLSCLGTQKNNVTFAFVMLSHPQGRQSWPLLASAKEKQAKGSPPLKGTNFLLEL